MRTFLILASLTYTGLSHSTADGQATTNAPADPLEAVASLETKFGVAAGYRRNHSKGLCFVGDFTPSMEAKNYTISPIFAGSSSRVIGRFSHAGGNLMAADNKSKVFGMALQLNKNDYSHQMAMLNLPFFDVASPEGFVAKIKAMTPSVKGGKPSAEKIAAFHRDYPESLKLGQYLKGKNRTPASYASQAFNSLHSFQLSNAQGKRQMVRWSFVPELGGLRPVVPVPTFWN